MALRRLYPGHALRPLPLRRHCPQILLILVCVATLFVTSASAYTNKNDNMCHAMGGVCKARTDCGQQDKQLSTQLCRGSNLHCCIQKDENETSEKRKKNTAIKKKSVQKNKKKMGSKESYINKKQGNKSSKLKGSNKKRILQENSNSKRKKYSPRAIEKDSSSKNIENSMKKFQNAEVLSQGLYSLSVDGSALKSSNKSSNISTRQKKEVGSSPRSRKKKNKKTASQSKGVGSSPRTRKKKQNKTTRQKQNRCAGKEKSRCKEKEGACQSRDTKCKRTEGEELKSCKSTKTCKCCVPCRIKSACKNKGGFCRNKANGCSKKKYIEKDNLCLPKDCVCCIPKPIPPPPPPPEECKLEDCEAENGQCVDFSSKCPPNFSFAENYVLCQATNCKCCLADPIPLITEPNLGNPIRDSECPKLPAGVSQTCPTCGLINLPTNSSRGRPARVTGSKPVDIPNKYPWLVWLKDGNQLRCGGAIISSQFVLTAAQCLYKVCELLPAKAINVVIADHNIKEDDVGDTCIVKSQELIPHPNYQPCSAKLHCNDIALIKLSKEMDVKTNEVLRPICLPTIAGETYLGLQAIIAGWGLTSINGDFPDIPHEAEVQVLGSSSCTRFWYWNEGIMLCAGGSGISTDACVGDSGIPLIIELSPGIYTVVGIVSGGDPNCKGPGVYTKVNQYLDWIKTTANLLEVCPIK